MTEGKQIRVGLLCAGVIGIRCLQKLLASEVAKVCVVFSYQLEPPQDYCLEQIRALCQSRGVQFHDGVALGDARFEPVWKELDLDYLFAVKWRTMIPRSVIQTVRNVVIFHASLLPRYRGFAPINWPLINDEPETGLTMFYAVDEVDAGDIIDQRKRAITDHDDAGIIDEWVNATVEEMLETNLARFANGSAPRFPQDHGAATYSIWRSPEDGHIDWSQPTRTIFNLVRGLTNPYPGAYALVEGRKLFIWSAEIEPQPRSYVGRIPGKVERIIPSVGVNVLTGDGVLLIKDVQFEGHERQNAAAILTRLKTRLC